MRHRLYSVTAAAITLCLMPQFFAFAARRPQASKSQNSSKTPDLSGVWFFQGGDVRSNFDLGKSSPLLPWAEERLKANQPKINPVLLCYPPGVPRVWTQPHPFEIVSLPGRVLIYYEFQHLVREIHTDGRPHSKDLIPTYMGDSVGSWDGNTLVIDTIGFNDETWLDNTKRPHSDALHLVERLQLVGADVLQLDITIDDPKAYAKPWTVQRKYDLKPGWEITEDICEENNDYLAPAPNPK